MSIKNFNTPEPENTPEQRTRSLFDPINPADHEAKSALGDRVYVDGEDVETDMEKLYTEMFGADAKTAAENAAKIVVAYELASRLPTKTNIQKFHDLLTTISKDPDLAKATLALQTATLVATLRQQR